jgi:peptidoglycan biosynthesis protein MviN/MurJ (putative lipid II flippase)
LASSIAGTLDFLALFYILNKRLGRLNSGLLGYFAKVALAGLITGICSYFVWGKLNFTHEFINLCFIGLFSIVCYEIVAVALKIEQAHKLWQWIYSVVRQP